MQKYLVQLSVMTFAVSLQSSSAFAGGSIFPQGPASDFAGFYAGAAVSWDRGDTSLSDIDQRFGEGNTYGAQYVLDDIERSGVGYDLFAGWNWQSGNVVYGVEATLTAPGQEGSSVVDNVNEDEHMEWTTLAFGAIDARLGYVQADWMFYGRAGVAIQKARFGYVNYDDSGSTIESDDRVKDTFTGFNLGAGVERKFPWAVGRLEVVYTDFPEKEILAIGSGADAHVGFDDRLVRVKAGVLFEF
jgi:outer membrane immunogenic protein